MSHIQFKDTCEITRPTGERDEWDNPSYDLVYSGECLYEAGGEYYSYEVIIKNAIVYIPQLDELIQTGDVVTIATEQGRIVKGYARSVRDISLTSSGLKMSRVEIEQAQDKEE